MYYGAVLEAKKEIPVQMHDFLKAWSEFELTEGPKILPGDRQILEMPEVRERYTVLHDSWDSVISQDDFGAKQNCGANDTRLHLSLLPEPFFGSVATAPVVILSLNPSLDYDGYYSEFFFPDYRKALIDTLRQRPDERFPHFWLNPRFAWHSGFSYWHGRLAEIVDGVADKFKTRLHALSFVSKSVATLELLPYHSAKFGLPKRIIKKLQSVELARSFAKDFLMQRVHSGEALLVEARRWWDLPNHPKVIHNGANRAGYLTRESQAAILDHLESYRQKHS